MTHSRETEPELLGVANGSVIFCLYSSLFFGWLVGWLVWFGLVWLVGWFQCDFETQIRWHLFRRCESREEGRLADATGVR